MNRSIRRPAAAVVVAACGAFVLSGCEFEKSAAGQPDQQQADVAAAESDPVVEGQRVLTAANFGDALATAQTQAGSVRTSGKIPLQDGMRLTWTADVSVGNSTDALRMVVLDTYAKLSVNETRIVGSDVYAANYAYGESLEESLNPQPWSQTTLAERDDLQVRNVAGLIRMTDPASIRDFYANVTSLDDLGTDQVAGVETRHYQLTVPATAVYGGIDRSALDEAEADELRLELAEVRDETLQADLWLDAAGLPVLAEVDGLSVRFSDWGESIDVAAPLPSEVGVASASYE